MHPELLNNPTFLRYNETWQRDPKSIVFAPLADFFVQYKLYADARKVCEVAVKYHPDSVLAHYSLAKAYLSTREWHSARHEAQWVIARVASHQGALDVLQQVEQHQVPVRHMVVQPQSKSVSPLAEDAPPTPAEVAVSVPMDTIAKVMEQSGGSQSPLSVVSKAAGGAETSSEGPPLLRGDGRSAATGPATLETTAAKNSRKPIPWQTVTMAKIYSQQGLYFKARTIYKAILSRDPQNTEATAGLATLERTMKDAAA